MHGHVLSLEFKKGIIGGSRPVTVVADPVRSRQKRTNILGAVGQEPVLGRYKLTLFYVSLFPLAA
jgi:hypothetical protein